MFPLPIIGVALAAKILLSKNGEGKKSVAPRFPIKSNIIRKPNNFKPFAPINPFETLFKGLNKQLSTILQGQTRESFNEVAERFVPEGGNILTPKYPLHSDSISYGDLDGDSNDELIVSYRHIDEIKTIILKKENNNWYKAAEIANSGYENVNYREVVDLTGEGKKQLIIALASKDKNAVLRSYSLDKGNLNELFNLNYNRLEVLKVPGNDRSNLKSSLAVWKKTENDAYNIELLHWNGSQLEPLEDTGTYYSSNVVPHYLKKVKREPESPQNWYNLADSLTKAGMNRDALIASEIGIQYDLSNEFKDKFEALNSKLSKV